MKCKYCGSPLIKPIIVGINEEKSSDLFSCSNPSCDTYFVKKEDGMLKPLYPYQFFHIVDERKML